MKSQPSLPHQKQRPTQAKEPFSYSLTYYRTEQQLRFYLQSFKHFSSSLVVVVAIREKLLIAEEEIPNNVKLIFTSNNDANINDSLGWFVSDPLKAISLALSRLHHEDGLIFLFPTSWTGSPVEEMIEQCRSMTPTNVDDDVPLGFQNPSMSDLPYAATERAAR